jgi:phosphate transport system permease protein
MISMPIGVLTALFIAKVAPKKIAEFLRTTVELLASIPSIVYGLFGSGVILVFVYNLSEAFGVQSKGGNSVLATVLVLALMTLPTITAISEVSIRSVGKDIELGSLSAKSGIFASAILGIGRALGEATAVSLVAGNAKSGPTLGIFDITSTLTSTMLEGLKETTGIDYDIRFSVGIVLMVVILLTNLSLNFVKKKVGNVDVK